jgi:hypothetical protein
MRRRTLLAPAGLLALAGLLAVAATAGALPAGSGPAVTIRIEGSKKTLLLPAYIKTQPGWITKYGAPRGKCSAKSAQGALDVATHGHWRGKWYATYNEYFIKSVLREKPAGSDYWEIFADNKPASTGACDLKLHRGEQLVFADTSGKKGISALAAPAFVSSGATFRVKLLGYSANGTSKPLAGVRIIGGGVKTNKRGVAKITTSGRGKLVLRANPRGYIRSEAVVRVGGPY